MNVLVDTSVWSLALCRRSPGGVEVEELRRLVDEGRAVLIGPIRQEILSGLRHREQFERLREQLRAFVGLSLEAADYERAAEHFNECRRRGLQGSNTDFLITAVAERREMPILTTDVDFTHFARYLPIGLHRVGR